MDSFLRYIEFEKRYSANTVLSYETDLRQFTIFLQETFELKNLRLVDHNLIRSWIISLMENNIDPRSINRKIACLKSFYKYLLKRGEIEKNPTLKVKSPKTKKGLPTFVEEQKMDFLLDQFEFEDSFKGVRDKLVLELLYGTGIRLSELIELTEQNINFTQNTIKVLGKGNKERIIPINDNLVLTLNIYKKEKNKAGFGNNTNRFIVTDKGMEAYPAFIYRMVKKYLEKVTTAEKKSPHVLRHSFATHLLNKGADLNAVKDLLGHASLAATQVYTHNSIDKLKKIFEKAHPKA